MTIGWVGDAIVRVRGVLEVLILRNGECTIRHADSEEEVDAILEEETGETLPTVAEEEI